MECWSDSTLGRIYVSCDLRKWRSRLLMSQKMLQGKCRHYWCVSHNQSIFSPPFHHLFPSELMWMTEEEKVPLLQKDKATNHQMIPRGPLAHFFLEHFVNKAIGVKMKVTTKKWELKYGSELAWVAWYIYVTQAKWFNLYMVLTCDLRMYATNQQQSLLGINN